jgi:hypothetical protein
MRNERISYKDTHTTHDLSDGNARHMCKHINRYNSKDIMLFHNDTIDVTIKGEV